MFQRNYCTCLHLLPWRWMQQFNSKLLQLSAELRGYTYQKTAILRLSRLLFIFCWPCISIQFVLIANLTKFFNVFISLLYVFRATQCSSSGESIVSIHDLVYTRVGTLIVATIYLQLIQNRYMFRSFTVLHCSYQHCVQPVASDVEVVGYL